MMECPFNKLRMSALNRDDTYYMSLAFNLAVDAWNKDEVPIGAVIIHNNNVIGSAHNMVETQKDPTAHAEILAITQAANKIGDWRLNECTLYVTKEPCPMCSGAMVMARVGKVVYAFEDEKMGCMGGNIAMQELKGLNHHPKVVKNILMDECKQLVQAFFQLKRGKIQNN